MKTKQAQLDHILFIANDWIEAANQKMTDQERELEQAKRDLLNFQKAQGADISKLEREYRLLKEENERLAKSWENQDVERLREENSKLCKLNNELIQENERLGKLTEGFEETLKDLQESNETKEERRLTGELNKYFNQIQELQRENKDLKQANDSLISLKAEEFKDRDTRELQEVKGRLEDVEIENQALREENKRLLESINANALDNIQICKDLDIFRERNSNLEGDIKFVRQVQDELEGQILGLRSEKTRLEGEIGERDRQIHILEKRLSTSLANNLCPDHRDKQVGKPCLACTIETLERRYKELMDSKIVTHEEELRICQEEKEAKQREIRSLKEQHEIGDKANNSLQKTNEELSRKLQQKKQKESLEPPYENKTMLKPGQGWHDQ